MWTAAIRVTCPDSLKYRRLEQVVVDSRYVSQYKRHQLLPDMIILEEIGSELLWEVALVIDTRSGPLRLSGPLIFSKVDAVTDELRDTTAEDVNAVLGLF